MDNQTKTEAITSTKKTVTFQRNIRSQSSTSFSNKQSTQAQTHHHHNQTISYKALIDQLCKSETKDKSNSLSSNDISRRSSSQSKHYIEDHMQRDEQNDDQRIQQNDRTEVSNLQEWINLKKFGKSKHLLHLFRHQNENRNVISDENFQKESNFEEQIENLINQHEVRQRPDIKTQMIDDIMNPSNSKINKGASKNKDQSNNRAGQTSSQFDKSLYKSSDYAKTYITNKNLLNQILQKKMREFADKEEFMVTKKQFDFDASRISKKSKLDSTSQKFLNSFEYSPDSIKFNDSNSQFFEPTNTLRKLLSQTQQTQQKQDKKRDLENQLLMNQLQKLTNKEARGFMNKFSGFQYFKNDICKSIIDYDAIKDAIITQDQDKSKAEFPNGKMRRSSSANSQKLIAVYQPDYPLEKYEKKKNSTQEEKDPFQKKEEQDKIQQYEALKEISQMKKAQYQHMKQQYKINKERIEKLGLQVIQISQQKKQKKQLIAEYTTKMEESLKQLSNNKRNNKSSKGQRYSNTDHDRNKVQIAQIDEEQNETQLTFSQFNSDYHSPLKHKQFLKKSKDQKSSIFEELEDTIESSKLSIKEYERNLLEMNITIERLQEDQNLLQQKKKDLLFELKKLYQVFIKNQENWRYEKVRWVLLEMYELGSPLTDDYLPYVLEPHSKEFLKQVLILKIQEKELDKQWEQWKSKYQMDEAIPLKLQDKSFTNLLDKMKRNIKLVRQSNIDVTVKRRADRPQCKETLARLMVEAENIMNQEAEMENKDKIHSKFLDEESEYKRKKSEILQNIDVLTKQEINRLFAKYPISSESSLKEIKNIFYLILPEFQAKRFSKKYQLLCESSAFQEQKNKKGINYDEIREKLKQSLNKSAQMRVVSSSQRKRAVSKDTANQSNNSQNISQQDASYSTFRLSNALITKDTSFPNISISEHTTLPFINLFDFYGMKTPQGNYTVV